MTIMISFSHATPGSRKSERKDGKGESMNQASLLGKVVFPHDIKWRGSTMRLFIAIDESQEIILQVCRGKLYDNLSRII